jgi:hypothetical protein
LLDTEDFEGTLFMAGSFSVAGRKKRSLRDSQSRAERRMAAAAGNLAAARKRFDIGFDGIRVVEIIHHQSVGLLAAARRGVGQIIEAFDARAVAEVKAGDRVVRVPPLRWSAGNVRRGVSARVAGARQALVIRPSVASASSAARSLALAGGISGGRWLDRSRSASAECFWPGFGFFLGPAPKEGSGDSVAKLVRRG